MFFHSDPEGWKSQEIILNAVAKQSKASEARSEAERSEAKQATKRLIL